MRNTNLIVLCFVLGAIGPSIAEQKEKAELQVVPIVRLLALPEVFENARIFTSGYLVCEFENEAIYLSKTFADISDSSSAFWVDISNSDNESWSETAFIPKRGFRGWVEIVGTFQIGNRGHFGLFSGEIAKIESISPIKAKSSDDDVNRRQGQQNH